jgi:putative glutamine amidotransferase
MTAPLIAVVGYRLPEGRVTHWPWAAVAVPARYVDAVVRSGGRPVILPPGQADAEAPDDALEPFDGLLLVGGGDIEPERYGAERHPSLYGVDGSRDAVEIALVHVADRAGVPLLAICRGCQVVNVAFGGTLHQHIPDLPDTLMHGVPGGGDEVLNHVSIDGSSLLARACGATEVGASCHHHQAIDRLGDGLRVAALAKDGLVEAVERPGGFLLGVQWHPEDTAANDPAQQALFDALVANAAARRERLRAPSPA